MENSFARMENKLDQQIEDITEIKVATGKMATELKNMNGRLLTHQKSIECHRKKINKFNYYLGIATGGFLVISFLMNILF